jgi:hypothetical protein
MALHCERHTAFLYDRGATTLLGTLGPLSKVEWERLRDDISAASVTIAERSHECNTTLGLAAAGRSELVIYRGDERVWEGPITHIAYQGESVTISARDVGHYVYRTIMKSEYNNSYPNITSAVHRVERILRTELVRMEAQDPPINLLPYLTAHHNTGDAGTSSHTLPYEMTVYEHMDSLAARGGLDYTVVGRAMHLWDVHQPALGVLPTVSQKDFLGDVVITEYGMDLATVSVVTDGRGRWGEAGGADPYFGLVEILETAYDEATGDQWDENDDQDPPEPPSEAEMRSQAQRILAGRNPTPVVVRVPDNSSLNPNGVLAIGDLVPGVHIPLVADLPGRTLSQLQKLDRVTVEETASGENIKVVLSPAPTPGSNEEDN